MTGIAGGDGASEAAGRSLRIFVSYRRQETPAWTRLLSRELGQRFDLFMDVGGIRPGSDFVDTLQQQLQGCDAMLAVIGPRWVTWPDDSGVPRLKDRGDWVRLEIEEGLRRKIPLIPVLVDGASMPKRQELPRSCAELARREAVRLTHESFDGDLERLLRALADIDEEKARQAGSALHESGEEAFLEGLRLSAAGDTAGAEAAYRLADERGHAGAAVNLGVLLQGRGDLSGAETAYHRADERGHGRGANNVGALMNMRGDLEGAEAAYRRADERGDAIGASNLGVLLKERGDLSGAEAAYRRADERGNGRGAANLGVLLKERGDLSGAEAAYRRADERGDDIGANNLGALLKERGDLGGAEAAYRRADERGHGLGAKNLGVLLEGRRDFGAAEAAYSRAVARGTVSAQALLDRVKKR